MTIDRPSELPDLPDDIVVALDTEGSGLHIDDGARVSIVSLAWMLPESDQIETRVFPFNQGVTEWKPEWTGQLGLFDDVAVNLDSDEWRCLLGWLADRNLVMHNANHDCPQMRAGVAREDGDWAGLELSPNVVWDTMLVCREIWPVESVGLKATAVRLGLLNPALWITNPRPGLPWTPGVENEDERIIKTYLKKHRIPTGRYDLIDWDVIARYASLDAELTLRLMIKQDQWLGDARQLGDFRPGATRVEEWAYRALELRRVLYAMEQRGIGFNAAGCLQAASSILDEQAIVAAALPFGTAPGKPHNDITINHARHYFFEQIIGDGAARRTRHQPYSMTPTGQIQLTSEIVGKMKRDKVKYAAEYDRWKKLGDSYSKWYAAYPNAIGPDGRLRPVYRQVAVKSSRLSVGRINLLAVPKDYQIRDRLPEGCPTIRELVTAREGHDLWSLDLGQAELRVGARWAKCQKMIDMIVEGVDLHAHTAITALGAVNDGSEDWALMRQVAKNGNFSLIFDVGPRTFQQLLSRQAGIEWPLQRVTNFIMNWRNEYPEFRNSVYQCMRLVESRGYVKLKNGKLSWFTEEERRMDAHKGFNRFVQASLAEFGIDWMLWIEATHPGVLVNWVHDAAYLEVAHDEEWRVQDIIDNGLRMFEETFDIPGSIDRHVEARGLVLV